jgi:hypothetical protein
MVECPCRSIQDEYELAGAEKFSVRPQSHQRKSSMLAESLGGRMAETLRSFQDRSQVYGGAVPAAVHGAPHTLKVQENFDKRDKKKHRQPSRLDTSSR